MGNNTYKEVEVKTDCILYDNMDDKKEYCKGLTELFCKKEICKFYKPRKNKQQQ